MIEKFEINLKSLFVCLKKTSLKVVRYLFALNQMNVDWLRCLPKCELHLHLEGTLEAEQVFEFAKRNGMDCPGGYKSIEELKKAYEFENLQSFLDIYYQAVEVLREEEDFYELTNNYLQRAKSEGVRHCEVFIDPQIHLSRGIQLSTLLRGVCGAMKEQSSKQKESERISAYLIVSFVRHLSEQDALETLEMALQYRHLYEQIWIGVGLDSGELGNAPSKFQRLFDRCHEVGLRCVAHAGEEGPPEYVFEALDLLKVERIDHGIRSEENQHLMQRLIKQQIPLTICPISNLKLKVVTHLSNHNLSRLLHKGACVLINSDDPAYFGAYLLDNYLAMIESLQLTQSDVIQLAKNSFKASFLPDHLKQYWLHQIDSHAMFQ